MAVTPNDGYVRVLSTLKSANDSFFVVNATDIGYYEYVNEDGIPSGDLMDLQQKIQSLLSTNEQMEETKKELSEAIASVDGNVKELSTTVSDNKAETNKSISSINNEIDTIKTNIENLDTDINNKIKENYDTLNTSITTVDGNLNMHIGKHVGRQSQTGLFSEIFNDYVKNVSVKDYSHIEGRYGQDYITGCKVLSQNISMDKKYLTLTLDVSSVYNINNWISIIFDSGVAICHNIGQISEINATTSTIVVALNNNDITSERVNYLISQYSITHIYSVNVTSGTRFISIGNLIDDAHGAHVEGIRNKGIGVASHAEGYRSEAFGAYSHAEGEHSQAFATASHAEGYQTCAYGTFSHAEGHNTISIGSASHAEGYETISTGRSTHVEGEYNIPNTLTYDRGEYLHIAGNGSRNNRSNAYTLDWVGNGWFASDVQIGKYRRSLKESIDTLNRLRYYGDATIAPTEDDMFRFSYNSITDSYDIIGLNIFDTSLISYPLSKLVIPYEYNGKMVTSITGIDRRYNTIDTSTTTEITDNYVSLDTVIVPSSITIIPEGAFSGFPNLTTLILPNSIVRMEDWCISGASLKKFKFPENIEYIGTDIFKWISDDEIYVPSSVSYIGDLTTNNSILVVEKDSYVDNLIYTHNHSWQYDNPLETPDGILFKYTKDFTIKSVLKAGEWINPGVITGYDKPTYDLGTDGGAYRYLVYPSQTMDISVSLDALDCTQEQYEAFNNAQLVGAYNTNEVIAFGDMPKIDIPVILKVVMK